LSNDDSRYRIHSRETAICVELALGTVEADIKSELEKATGPTADALLRVLEKMRERHKVLEQFMQVA
jgi:hypothetical protein